MTRSTSPITLLVVDDDAEDRMMIKEALQESHVSNSVQFLENGEELMSYLNKLGKYEDTKVFPRPGLILLDLNMPKKDGREALREIKSDSTLRDIPVVVLTTSRSEEDIIRSYNLGVNSFISKPVTFDQLVTVIKDLKRYWLEIVELPKSQD